MNKGLLKNLAGDSVVYGLSGLLVRFLSFFLFPFFARKFDPEDYGVINIFNTMTFFVNAVIVLGLDAATTRWFYDSENKKYRAELFSTWFFTHFSLAIFSALIILTVGHFYFLDRFIDNSNKELILLAVVCNIILQVGALMTNSFLVLNRKPRLSASFSFFNALFATGFSLYFVFKLEWGVLGFFLGQTISFFLYFIVGYFVVLKRILRFAYFRLSLLKQMIRYGVGVIPANVSNQLALFVVSLILQTYTSQKELGYFQIGLTLSTGIMLITWPFTLAFQPLSFSIMNKPGANEFYVSILNLYCVVLSAICVFLGLFFPDIIRILLTDKYSSSSIVATVLSFSTFIYSLNNIANMGMAKAKKIKFFGIVITIANIFTLTLAYFGVIWFGFVGVGLAMLIGQSAGTACVFYMSQKIYYIPYQFKKVSTLILSAIAIFFLYEYLIKSLPVNSILLRTSLLLLYIGLTLFLFPSTIAKTTVMFQKIKSSLWVQK